MINLRTKYIHIPLPEGFQPEDDTVEGKSSALMLAMDKLKNSEILFNWLHSKGLQNVHNALNFGVEVQPCIRFSHFTQGKVPRVTPLTDKDLTLIVKNHKPLFFAAYEVTYIAE